MPGFSGFHANMAKPTEKSRAIYHMDYPDPPSKTILYDIMYKLTKSINDKNMPFGTIVGDHPVYVLRLALKCENAVHFNRIVPFMGPFHIQMLFIYAIYKRFKGSGISDVLVAAGVIVEGSVDQELCGKHLKRGVTVGLSTVISLSRAIGCCCGPGLQRSLGARVTLQKDINWPSHHQ